LDTDDNVDEDCREVAVNAKLTASIIGKMFLDSIVTFEEIFVVTVEGINLVGRFAELCPDKDVEIADEENNDGDMELDDDHDLALPDHYRGVVDASTEIFVAVDDVEASATARLVLVDSRPMPQTPPPKDIVHILTNDLEVFPVKRRLLRPCIALTAVVQAGRGRYKDIPSDPGHLSPTPTATVTATATATAAIIYVAVVR
jgi:hypothetical protein